MQMGRMTAKVLTGRHKKQILATSLHMLIIKAKMTMSRRKVSLIIKKRLRIKLTKEET